MNKINLAIIEGTSRPGRRSFNVAKLIEEMAGQIQGVETVFVDPLEFKFPHDGDQLKDPKYTKITEEANAFFIITPEYNHSYPGSLKRLLDSEFDNYMYKPVGIAGVSTGPWGGVRAIEALIPVLKDLKMFIISPDLQFPMIKDTFDQDGKLLKEEYRNRVQRSLNELIWITKVLRDGIANNPKDR